MKKATIYFLILVSLAFTQKIQAQDLEDIMDELSDEDSDTNYTFATFKATRVINLHSIQNLAEGVLDFRIAHRFGRLNSGYYELFGLDQAGMRMSFEYGLTDRITVGLGRSGNIKALDGFAKVQLLRQSSGAKNMPIALSYFASTAYGFAKRIGPVDLPTSARFDFCHQLILARKFNEKLSLQLSPGLVHRNLVATREEANDVIHLGFGGRYLITNSVSLNLEYIYVLPNLLNDQMNNSFSIGFDIETGGHVFQLHFTNSLGMIERAFITQTNGDWLKGDIHFGFNISRVFTLKDKKR